MSELVSGHGSQRGTAGDFNSLARIVIFTRLEAEERDQKPKIGIDQRIDIKL